MNKKQFQYSQFIPIFTQGRQTINGEVEGKRRHRRPRSRRRDFIKKRLYRDTEFVSVRRSESFLGYLNLFIQVHRLYYISNRRLIASVELEIMWQKRIATSSNLSTIPACFERLEESY
jgi:hypothetical protein